MRSIMSEFTTNKCSLSSCESGKQGNDLKTCSRCKKAQYCSVDCQKADWSNHKPGCKASSVSKEEKMDKVDPSAMPLTPRFNYARTLVMEFLEAVKANKRPSAIVSHMFGIQSSSALSQLVYDNWKAILSYNDDEVFSLSIELTITVLLGNLPEWFAKTLMELPEDENPAPEKTSELISKGLDEIQYDPYLKLFSSDGYTLEDIQAMLASDMTGPEEPQAGEPTEA